MKILITGVTISIALLLGACSDSGGSNNSETPASDSIAGLWDTSDVDTAFGKDIHYSQIFADGRVVDYDYQQDGFNAGDNCYLIDRAQTFTPLGGNLYRSDIAGFPEKTYTMTISRSGNVLTVSYADQLDENVNGNLTEILTFNYPLLIGVDPVFNECV